MSTSIKKCPECGSIHLTYDSHLGEIILKNKNFNSENQPKAF